MSNASFSEPILLIEDDVGLAELVRERLGEQQNQPIIHVQTGQMALEWLAQNQPLLILLDYSLPDMSGAELVARLKAGSGNPPPFIVTTGAGDERIAVAMMKLGARDYLVKDHNFLETLPRIVAQVMKEFATERQLTETEASLDQSRENLRSVLETIPDFVLQLAPDLTVQYINRTYPGVRLEEVIGTPILNWIQPEHRAAYEAMLNQALTTGQPQELETVGEGEGGQPAWYYSRVGAVRVKDRVTGLTLIGQDITPRKLVEKSLSDNLRLLRNIIDSSVDLIFVKDRELRTILCNAAFAAAIGKKPEEIYGKTDLENGWDAELIKGNPAKNIRGFENDDRLALQGQTVHNPNDPANVGDAILYFDTIKQPLRDADDKIIGVLGTSRDVTAHKLAEQRVHYLTRLYAVLSQVNQMIVRVKERLELFQGICQIAHDFGEFRLAWIGLREPHHSRLLLTAIAGDEQYTLPFSAIDPEEMPFKEGLTGLAMHSGQVEYSNNIQTDPRMSHWREFAVQNGIFSAAAIPFRQRGHVIGLLNLYATDANFFVAEEEQRLLDEMSLDISFALDTIASEKQRRQVEEALRTSEVRFRTIFDIVPVGISILDSQRRITDMNPALEAILSITKESLLAGQYRLPKYLRSDGTPKPPNEFASVRAAHEQRPIINVETGIMKEDGSVIWTLVHAAPLPDGGVAVVTVDITERKQAEAALQESQRLFYNIFHASPTAIALNRMPDWSFVEANEKFLDLTGYTLDEIVGRTSIELGMVTDAKREERLEELQQGHLLPDFELEVVRKTGERRRGLVSVAPVSMKGERFALFNFRDITERKQAEDALRQSEAKFRNIIELSPVPYALNDDQQNIVCLNRAFTQIFGYTLQDIPTLADWWLRAYPDPDYRVWVATSWQARLEKARQTGAAFEPIEINIRCKDGATRTALASAGALSESLNGVHLVILYDITERKQAEEQLRQALREKETLLRELYHRTKNNMMVITSLLSLQAGNTENVEVKNVLRDMENRILSMSLVHKMLYQAKDLSQIQLHDYIEELSPVILDSYSLDPGQISLQLDLAPAVVLIDAAIPCGLVLNELLSNALKYAFPDNRRGEIRIKLRPADNNTVEIDFADNGIGVPSGFDFRRQTTLGLQTIISLVEQQLGGQITFEVRDGVACRLRFGAIYARRV